MTYKSKGISQWIKQYLACDRKKFYISKKVAEKRAKKDTKRYGEEMKVYKCPCCIGFHLTKK